MKLPQYPKILGQLGSKIANYTATSTNIQLQCNIRLSDIHRYLPSAFPSPTYVRAPKRL